MADMADRRKLPRISICYIFLINSFALLSLLLLTQQDDENSSETFYTVHKTSRHAKMVKAGKLAFDFCVY